MLKIEEEKAGLLSVAESSRIGESSADMSEKLRS
jgi:hypothetical protein